MPKREYHEIFEDWGSLAREFTFGYNDDSREVDFQPEPTYVYAWYAYVEYSGDAVVIYSDDGVDFFVVEGSHCSCYGLEDQWDPSKHSLEEILKMTEPQKGKYYGLYGMAAVASDVRRWLKENNLSVG